jgi:osmotically-inducible protein OsmY
MTGLATQGGRLVSDWRSSQLPYSAEEVKANVKDGWVTLDGEVEWNYWRVRAEAAARRVRGVQSVTSLVGPAVHSHVILST